MSLSQTLTKLESSQTQPQLDTTNYRIALRAKMIFVYANKENNEYIPDNTS